jgi:hypothetical protein
MGRQMPGAEGSTPSHPWMLLSHGTVPPQGSHLVGSRQTPVGYSSPPLKRTDVVHLLMPGAPGPVPLHCASVEQGWPVVPSNAEPLLLPLPLVLPPLVLPLVLPPVLPPLVLPLEPPLELEALLLDPLPPLLVLVEPLDPPLLLPVAAPPHWKGSASVMHGSSRLHTLEVHTSAACTALSVRSFTRSKHCDWSTGAKPHMLAAPAQSLQKPMPAGDGATDAAAMLAHDCSRPGASTVAQSFCAKHAPMALDTSARSFGRNAAHTLLHESAHVCVSRVASHACSRAHIVVQRSLEVAPASPPPLVVAELHAHAHAKTSARPAAA